MNLDAEDRRRLVRLDRHHPGFRDPVYRSRRDAIAPLAIGHTTGLPVADAPYTAAEHEVWAAAMEQLASSEDRVCRPLRDASAQLALPSDRIPQLAEVDDRIGAAHGMTIEPVAGLVAPEVFLRHLGRDALVDGLPGWLSSDAWRR